MKRRAIQKLLLIVFALSLFMLVATGCGECKHKGGTATCSALAVCQDCNQPYGQYDTTNHQALTTTVVSQPTCTTDGATNYSCSSCGYNETKTTPKLSQTGHNYEDGICTTCNFLAPSTSGLEFTLNDDGNSYTCTGIGSCTSTQIFIGSYNNKPVTTIGDYAFYDCSNLTSVTLGNSVTSIGNYAFFYCSNLASIVIPNSLTSIGKGAFDFCSNLTSIEAATDNPNYCSQDGNLYNKDKTTLILYACGKTATTFTIPDSVTSIGELAFDNCDSLTSIVIPNSVTSIGEWAFANCSNLTSVTLGNSVTSIGGSAFFYCTNLTSVTLGNSVTSIGNGAFEDCASLTSIVIPDSVTSIGALAFSWCTNLTSVTLGNSVTSIGDCAFAGCNNLTSIVIPDSVTSIGAQAFDNCSNLTIYCQATEKPSGWSDYWNYTNCPVYWAGQWHYDDNGNPTPNN